MKFVTGLLTGVALGAAGAVYYSVKSGKDLRATFDDVRGEIDARNYDALGARIERGFADLQTQIEERMNQVRAGANAALEEAEEGADDVTNEVGSQLDEGDPDDLGADAASLADDATDAIDSVEDGVSDGADDVAAAAGDVVGTGDTWSSDRT
jgi:gas vesicle protein